VGIQSAPEYCTFYGNALDMPQPNAGFGDAKCCTFDDQTLDFLTIMLFINYSFF